MDTADLELIVGADHVLTGAEREAHTVSGVVPEAVVAPGTREEAAAVIQLAAERGWALVPYGAGTQISLGSVPRRFDIALSTRRLNRVVDYQPDDMTVTLEPGVTMAELERLLDGRGQFLPLNPPLPDRATVGGVVASAAYGSWCVAYGSPRDWVIGCRVVGTDGKEIRGGGLVVKNVAGYDLPKLYTGSFGTLGLMTEITFKVLPQAGISAYCTLDASTPEQVEGLVAAIRDSDLQPAALELLGGSLASDTAAPWQLFVQLLHVPDAVEWQATRLAEVAEAAGCHLTRLPVEEGARLLTRYRDLPAEAPFVARIGTISSRIADLAARAAQLVQEQGDTPAILAHAANGRLHVTASGADAALCRALRALAAEAGASCLFPRLPVSLVGEIDPWGPLGPELRLMQGIKTAYDPRGIFSPGRFVGGI